MAPVVKTFRAELGDDAMLISTGQHREMLDQVFDWFDLMPNEDLGVMTPNQTLSSVMSKSLTGLQELIDKHEPDVVLAQGDTTTVMASALAAFHNQVSFGHVEAGLRTHDLSKPFPEEGFRQMAGRVAKWHFAPTRRSAEALEAEKTSGTVHTIGNTVIDALLDTAARAPEPEVTLKRNKLCLITGHRRENHGPRFEAAFGSLAELARRHDDVDFVYPVHLNPRVHDAAHRMLKGLDNIQLIAPVAYPQMAALMKRARLIITDSGGVQEEAPSLGVPVLVMRESTERQEAVECGAAKLVGTNPELIIQEASALITDDLAHRQMVTRVNPFGDGRSAVRIVDIVCGRESNLEDGEIGLATVH